MDLIYDEVDAEARSDYFDQVFDDNDRAYEAWSDFQASGQNFDPFSDENYQMTVDDCIAVAIAETEDIPF